MSNEIIKKPLVTTFANIKKNADRLIKKDPIRALVELITNSDDSYRDIENVKKLSSGKIIINLIRSRTQPIIQVIDEAQGMDDKIMDRVVSQIGQDSYINLGGTSKRGFFKEGLKFAIVGLGSGDVCSIKDNILYRCSISDSGEYKYDPSETKEAIPLYRDKYLNGAKDNGTSVKIYISRKDVKPIPLFDKLIDNLSKHFSLRDLLANPNRLVYLYELGSDRKIKFEEKINYKFPKGDLLLNKKIPIKEYGTSVTIEIYKSDNPLPTRWEVGPDLRENGLLIRSKGSIHDITLFRFDNEDYKDISSYLFGHATCDYIQDLMDKGDYQVINDSRDGINEHHEFIKTLKATVESEIKAIIEKERKEQEKKREILESKKMKQLINKNLSLLNKIAKDELKDIGIGPSGNKKNRGIPIPPDGFNFFPEIDYIVIGKKYSLKLIGDTSIVPLGSIVDLTIDNFDANKPDVELSPYRLKIEKEDIIENNIWQKNITIRGKKLNAQKTISANYNDRYTEAIVTVIKGTGKTRNRATSGGLIKDIIFDPNGEPNVRVRFNEGIIKIHTKAPTVKRYFGPNGEGQDKLHLRILMAELISESLVRYLVNQKALAGDLAILDFKKPQESIELEQNRLQYKYSHLIHQGFIKSNEV